MSSITAKGSIAISQKEIIDCAEKIIKEREENGFTKSANIFCNIMATIAFVHSGIIVEKLRQRELEFQEASAEHYVQQREEGEIFNNWVDDI